MNDYETAQHYGWKHYCGDIPIDHPALCDFWLAIKKKMPELVLLRSKSVHNNTVIYNEEGNAIAKISVANKISVAHVKAPTEEVGCIAYDRHEQKFEVWSRLITNDKYSRWSSEHRCQKSVHMNKVIKIAQRVLVPKEINEVIDENSDKFLRSISHIRDTANDGMRGHVASVAIATWREELMHMASVGYVPTSAAVKKAMDYVVETKEQYDRDSAYNPDRAFVWLTPTGVTYKRMSKNKEEKFEVADVPSVEHLPEELRGKVCVLSVCEPQKFVEEVGMKMDDSKFWVIV